MPDDTYNCPDSVGNDMRDEPTYADLYAAAVFRKRRDLNGAYFDMTQVREMMSAAVFAALTKDQKCAAVAWLEER